MIKLTIEQKAKRYEVFENALLKFLDEKIADARCDDSEVRGSDVVYEWISEVDDSSLLPEDAYYLIDTILFENFREYHGESACTLPYFKKKFEDFKKRIK